MKVVAFELTRDVRKFALGENPNGFTGRLFFDDGQFSGLMCCNCDTPPGAFWRSLAMAAAWAELFGKVYSQDDGSPHFDLKTLQELTRREDAWERTLSIIGRAIDAWRIRVDFRPEASLGSAA